MALRATVAESDIRAGGGFPGAGTVVSSSYNLVYCERPGGAQAILAAQSALYGVSTHHNTPVFPCDRYFMKHQS